MQNQLCFIFVATENTTAKCLSYQIKYLGQDKQKEEKGFSSQSTRIYSLAERIHGVFITNNEIQKIPETTYDLKAYVASFEILQDDDYESKTRVQQKGHYGYTKQAKVILWDYDSPIDEMPVYVKFDETVLEEVRSKFPLGKLIRLKQVRRKLSLDLRFNFILDYEDFKVDVDKEGYMLNSSIRQR